MSSDATPFAILAWVGTVVLHGTLLMVAALALGRRVRSLWLRERVLRVAFFGGFVTATVGAIGFEPLLGRIPLARLAPPGGAASALRAASQPALELATPPDGLALELAAPPDGPAPRVELALARGSEPRAEPAALEGSTGAHEPRPAARASAAWESLLAHGGTQSGAAWLALGVWGLWCLAAWGRTARGLFCLRRSLRDRAPLQGPIAADLVALRRRARVHVPVRLSVSARASVPVTLGFFRREICLPRRALDAFTRAELRAILAHELAHTKRRDSLWFLAYALVERAFAFQPLQRRVRRELLATAELDCDDQAVGWTGAGLELASSLTEIARWIVAAGGQRLPVPTMADDRSRLGRRVMRLLEAQATGAPRERRALAGIGSLLVLGGVCALAPALGAAARPERSPLAALQPAQAAVATPALDLDPASDDATLAAAAEASEPSAPDAALPPRAGAPYALQLDQELLGTELELLDDELGLLRAELERLAQPRLAQAMADIDRRVELLAQRRQRMNELLERVFDGETLDVGGAPRADVPPESP